MLSTKDNFIDYFKIRDPIKYRLMKANPTYLCAPVEEEAPKRL